MKKINQVNIAHSRNKKYKKLLEKISEANVCPFCQTHLTTYHEKPLLKKTSDWILTENMNPYDGTKIHLLFILKRHAKNILDLKNTEIKNLFKLIKWSIKKYKIPGGSVIIRFGDTDYTGGSVSHLHAQLVSGNHRKNSRGTINPVLGYKQ